MKLRGAIVALLALGCAHTGPFVWVDEYRPAVAAADGPYLLGPGDVLTLRVFGHEELSAPKVRVRTDGRISVPLSEDVAVAGLSVDALTVLLKQRFKPFVNNPAITVTLDEPRPFTISVVGEVTRPGLYPIDARSGVLSALASAGGFTPFAHEDRIFVLRRSRDALETQRIRFTYEALAHAEGSAATFLLRRDDVVVVE
jgi:polysaccharide export outer membrane protein